MVQIWTYSYVKFEKLQNLDLSMIPNFNLFVTYVLEISKFGPFDMYILDLFDIYLLRRSKFGPFCIFFTICIFLIRISYKVPNLDLFIRPEFGLFIHMSEEGPNFISKICEITKPWIFFIRMY